MFKFDQIREHSSVVESIRLQIERSLVETRVLPLRLFIDILKLRKFSRYICLGNYNGQAVKLENAVTRIRT